MVSALLPRGGPSPDDIRAGAFTYVLRDLCLVVFGWKKLHLHAQGTHAYTTMRRCIAMSPPWHIGGGEGGGIPVEIGLEPPLAYGGVYHLRRYRNWTRDSNLYRQASVGLKRDAAIVSMVRHPVRQSHFMLTKTTSIQHYNFKTNAVND
jgi:hypothetical protein